MLFRFVVYSIDHAINAGLDLEMPGLNKWRTYDLVTRSISSFKVMDRTLKERARNVLNLVQKCARGAPEVRLHPVGLCSVVFIPTYLTGP